MFSISYLIAHFAQRAVLGDLQTGVDEWAQLIIRHHVVDAVARYDQVLVHCLTLIR